MIVSYQANWMPGVGHFEFRSPHEPPKRIPVSETGYRSLFAPMEEIAAFDSPQDYAREAALSMLRKRPADNDPRQLVLF